MDKGLKTQPANSIGDLEEWKLLVAVCPVLAYNHPWVASDGATKSVEVVKTQAKVLKVGLMEISVYVDTSPNIADEEEVLDEFILAIGSLLSSLECLVSNFTTDLATNTSLQSASGNLEQICPKLLALSSLTMARRQDTLLSEYSRFLCLEQDTASFKKTCFAVKQCMDTIRRLSMANLTTNSTSSASITLAQAQTTASYILANYWSNSNRLFDSLVKHIGQCQVAKQQSNHKAMLHLGHSRDYINKENEQPGIVLLSCPKQQAWHPMFCKVSSSIQVSPSISPGAAIESLCAKAEEAYTRQRLFSIELQGSSFFDMSDLSSAEHPDAQPTKPLSDLLTDGILKDQYRFRDRDKRILAFTVAHALVQLWESHWIQTHWTMDDLFFMYEASTSTVCNIHQPYISCMLSDNSRPPDALDPEHPFPLLLSFAKFLKELHTGEVVLAKQVEWSKTPSLLIPLQEYCKKDVYYMFDDDFGEALDACVNFSRYLKIEHKKTPQEIILSHIVHPLQRRLGDCQRSNWGDTHLDLRVGISTIHEVASESANPAQQPLTGQHQHTRYRLETRAGPSRTRQVQPRASIRTSAISPSPYQGLRKPPPPKSIGISPQKRTAPNNSLPGPSQRLPRSNKTIKTLTTNIQSLKVDDIQPRQPNVAPPTSSRIAHHQISEFGAYFSTPTISNMATSTLTISHINNAIDRHFQCKDKDEVIKIAVLDTGFDANHDDFKQPRTKTFHGQGNNISNPVEIEIPQLHRIKACRNFCPETTGHEHNNSNYYDDVPDLDGHGTQVAGIILRLAPRSQLYIARVCFGEKAIGVPESQTHFKRPQPEAVVKAIRWAISEGVHIINMSFGFTNYRENQVSGLKSALNDANSSRIIVFAATCNDGTHEQVAWPANDSNYAIGVHSCIDTGVRKSDFTADASVNGVNFLALGEGIISQRLTSLGGGFTLCTGSSFATPVAVAIAALVLSFSEQTVCRRLRDEANACIAVNEIRTKSGMIKVLRKISKPMENYWSLSPHIFWTDYHAHLNNGPSHAMKHAWRIITEALTP